MSVDSSDDDLSSLGDASPMEESAIQFRRRQRKARTRFGSCCLVSSYVLISLYFTQTPPIVSDDIYSIQNKTRLTEMRHIHVRQVASTIARVYPPVSPSVWCIDGRLKHEQPKRRPMGLCYLKLPRAASSTLSGINRRIALSFARRQNLQNCIRHDGHVPGMYYHKRDSLSFLWTLVRDPTTRAMSRIAASLGKQRGNTASSTLGNYSSFVIQSLQTANDLQYGAVSAGRGGFQLQYGMLGIIDEYSAWNISDPTQIVDPRQVQRNVQQVIRGYDFIGVVERFDESLVALQLLLGLETSDILYFATKTHIQYERRPVKSKPNTFYCQQALDPKLLMTPPVRNYFESTEWFAQNYGDYLLYQAANLSLDRTIISIGLDVFSRALKDLRSLLRQASETCHPFFPCSSNGTEQYAASQENCYNEDIGCGYPCLDELASQSQNT
jgi:hypothetical protein